MQLSTLAKRILKYLPILVVLGATVIGLLIGKDLYPNSRDTEPNNLQQPITLGTMSPCGLSNIYTSLPPKCKTLDGKYLPLPGTSPRLLVTPASK